MFSKEVDPITTLGNVEIKRLKGQLTNKQMADIQGLGAICMQI